MVKTIAKLSIINAKMIKPKLSDSIKKVLFYLSFRTRPEQSEGTRSRIVYLATIAKTFSHRSGSLVSLGTGSGCEESLLESSKIPRGACPEPSYKIPRFARNDSKRRARNDTKKSLNLGKKRNKLLLIFIISILFISPTSLYAESGKARPHGDRSKLLKGCASCHKGHGVFNTPMLPERKEVFCFRCHGHSINVEKAKSDGDLAGDVMTANIQREFEKPYHHPIEKIGIHKYGEILPEVDASMPRHSECGDCHHHHYVKEDNKMSGVRGTNKDGVKVRISSEYELCFNCHSYSANLPADQTNKAEIFNPANPSFHPVIAPGTNSDVPSLVPPLTTSSLIKCTDCHNNDDPSGPKGPHGSNYRYILSKNYTTTDGSEGPFQYELCYSCHRRSSILADESFQFHSLHIATVGTSCRTCHNPHGSLQYKHLIDFNRASVMPSNSGQLDYTDFGSRAGQCSLNCHGKDHAPAVYPAAASTLSPSRYPSRSPSLYPLGR